MDLPIHIPDEPRRDMILNQDQCVGTFVIRLHQLIYPTEYTGHFERLLISRQEILDCVKLLAERIHRDYKGERPVLVSVLKGANNFYQHLLEALQELGQGYYTEFLKASSYEGASSTGTVSVVGLSFETLQNRHVILVEDIVDTGTTLSHLMPLIRRKSDQIKSLEVCSLLQKRLEQPPKVAAKYIGFSIPNQFVVGYGLDYNELYRDVREIHVISQAGIDFDQSTLF